jgi:hypothetical protein
MCDDSLPNHVLAPVIAAIRQVIENDPFPHALRLDPLRAALARLGRGEANRGDEGGKRPGPREGDKPGLRFGTGKPPSSELSSYFIAAYGMRLHSAKKGSGR